MEFGLFMHEPASLYFGLNNPPPPLSLFLLRSCFQNKSLKLNVEDDCMHGHDRHESKINKGLFELQKMKTNI